jgi:hypothetical protein
MLARSAREVTQTQSEKMATIEDALERLQAGKPAKIRWFGACMRALDLKTPWVTFAPIGPEGPQTGDIVFARIGGVVIRKVTRISSDCVCLVEIEGEPEVAVSREQTCGKLLLEASSG